MLIYGGIKQYHRPLRNHTIDLHPPNSHPPWQSLETPQVRDLAWSCLGAPLFTPQLGGFSTLNLGAYHSNLLAWLRSLDAQPEALIRHLDAGPHSRLGLYFENLLQFLLTEGFNSGALPYKLIGHNLAIREQGTTLGEIDFLLKDRDDAVLHLETAVKFYLLRETNSHKASHWSNWIGPNGKDRLDIKLAHLLEHQLQRSKHPATIHLLSSQGIHANQMTPVHWLRGILFYPLDNELNFKKQAFYPGLASSPEHSHSGHERGFWLHQRNISRLEKTPVKRWYILERAHWLGGHHLHSKALNFNQLQLTLDKRCRDQNHIEKAIMLEPVTETDKPFARVMLVSDSWPQE